MVDKTPKHTIHVNNKPYHTNEETLTGAGIKALAKPDGVGADFELFLVHEPGGSNKPDEPIADTQVVTLRNGMKFRAIPRGDRGCSE